MKTPKLTKGENNIKLSKKEIFNGDLMHFRFDSYDKYWRIIPIFIVAMIFAFSEGNAQTLIAGWDFQTTTTGGTAAAAAPGSPTQFTANFGNGVLYANGQFGSSAWVTSSNGNQITAFTGTTLNAGAGFSNVTSGAASLGLLNSTANGKAIVFAFSMTGYQDLFITYAAQKTATGFDTHTWEYSLNGSNYSPLLSFPVPNAPFALKEFGLINTFPNASIVYLRLQLTGATTATGNNRIDNIQISGTPWNDQSTADFRTKSGVTNGDYSDASNWEYNNIGTSYTQATQAPTASNQVTITEGTTVILNAVVPRSVLKEFFVAGTLDCADFPISGGEVIVSGTIKTTHISGLEGTCPGGITLSPGSTVEYTGGSASTGIVQTITPRVYENLVCGGLQRLGGDITVHGDMAISPSCSLVASTPLSHTLTFTGTSFDCQGLFIHGGDIVFSGTSNLIWSPRSNCTFDDVTISGGQEVTCLQLPGIDFACYDISVFNSSRFICSTPPGTGSELSCNSISVAPGSTFRAPSSVFSVVSSFDMQGSFEHNNGEVDFRPPVGTTCTVCGDFTGTNSFHDQRNSLGQINVCGDYGYTVNGVLTHESGSILFDETPSVQIGTLHVKGGHYVSKGHNNEIVLVSESFVNDGGVIDLDGSQFTIGGDVVLNSGVCNADSAEITVYGNWSQGSPSSFNPGSSRVNWAGTLSVVVAGSNQIAYYHMQTNKSPGATVDFSNRTVTVSGACTNNSSPDAFLWGTQGRLVMSGTDCIIDGTSSTSLLNLTIDGGYGGFVGLGNDVAIYHELLFSSGSLQCATFTCTLDEDASVTGASSSSFVAGKLSWKFSSQHPARNFAVGDPASFSNAQYSPVSIECPVISTPEYITVSTLDGDHPDVNASGLMSGRRMHKPFRIEKEIDRTTPLLLNTVLNWNPIFNDPAFSLTDISAAVYDTHTAPFQWSLSALAPGTIPTFQTWTGTISLTSTSIVQVGNVCTGGTPADSPYFVSRSSGDWNDPNIWSFFDGCTTSNAFTIPEVDDEVIVLFNHSVSLSSNVVRHAPTTISGSLDCSVYLFDQTEVPPVLTQTGRLFTAHPNGLGGTCPNGITLSSGSTVEYTGGSSSTGVAQTITPRVYENLVCSGLQRLGGDIIVNGDFTIQSTCTLKDTTPHTTVITFKGTFTNSGTFEGGGTELRFEGSGDQQWIHSATASSSLYGDVSVESGHQLTISSATLTFIAGDLDICGNGTVVECQTANAGNAIKFGKILNCPSGKFIAPSSTLTITDGWSMLGAFDHNNGRIVFSPPIGVTCTITGDMTGSNSFSSVTVSGGGVCVCAEGWELVDALTIESGTIEFTGTAPLQMTDLVILGGIIKGGNRYINPTEDLVLDGGIAHLQNGNVVIGGVVDLISGTCYGENSNITAMDDWFQSTASSFVPGTSTMFWSGAKTFRSVSSSSGQLDFHNMVFNSPPGTTVDFTNQTVSLYGDLTNNSSPTAFVNGRYVLRAGIPLIGGISGTTFKSLELACSTGSCTLQNDITVQDELIFTNGKLECSTFTCTLDEDASVMGASSSRFVEGKVRWHYSPSHPSRTYPIGSTGNSFYPSSSYSPATITITTPVPPTGGYYGVEVADDDLYSGVISSSGLATGRRMHKPLKITKEWEPLPPGVQREVLVNYEWDTDFNDPGLTPQGMKVASVDLSAPPPYQWSISAVANSSYTSVNYLDTDSDDDGVAMYVFGNTCTPTHEYRSKQDGLWSSISTWEYYDGCSWTNAFAIPEVDDEVLIMFNDTVTLDAEIFRNDSLIVDGTLDCGVFKVRKGGVVTGTIIINNGNLRTSNIDGLDGTCPDGGLVLGSGCTVDYYGGSAVTGVFQTITPRVYEKLIFSGNELLNGHVTAKYFIHAIHNGRLTCGSGLPGSNILSVEGNMLVEGMVDLSTCTVEMTGSGTHTLTYEPLAGSPQSQFGDLIFDNPLGVFEVHSNSATDTLKGNSCRMKKGVVKFFNETKGFGFVQHVTIDSTATLEAGSCSITIGGDWTNYGTFTAGSSTVRFKCPDGSEALNPKLCATRSLSGGMDGSNAFDKLVFESGTSVSNSPVQTRLLSITLGSVVLRPLVRVGTAPLSVASITVSPSGSLDLSEATLEFMPSSGTTCDDQSSASIYGAVQIDNGAAVSLGSSTIRCTGDWTDNGILIPGSSTVIFEGTSNSTVEATITPESFHNIIVSKSSSGGITMKGQKILQNFSINTGSVNANQAEVDVTGEMTVHGQYDGGNGKLTFDGTTAQVITYDPVQGSPSSNFGEVSFSNTSSAGVLISGSSTALWLGKKGYDYYKASSSMNVAFQESFTIASGATMEMSGATEFTLGGDWTNNGGTFIPGISTVIFSGTPIQAIGGTSPTTFYNFKTRCAGCNDPWRGDFTNDIHITGLLEFVSGTISTNAHSLFLEEDASVTGANADSYVEGTVRWHYSPAHVSRTFPVGSEGNSFNPSSSYSPATITITTPIPPSGGYYGVEVADDDLYSGVISSSGLATGRRMHKPLKITKEWEPLPPGVQREVLVNYEWDTDFNDPGLTPQGMKVASVDLSAPPPYQWSISAVANSSYTSVNYLDTDSDDDGVAMYVFGNVCTPTHEYRSIQSGLWSSASTWETYDGCAWQPAVLPPSSIDVVSIGVNDSVELDGDVIRDVLMTIEGTLDCGEYKVRKGGVITGSIVVNNGNLRTADLDGLDGTFPDDGLVLAGGCTIVYTGGDAANGVFQTITPRVYENLTCSGLQKLAAIGVVHQRFDIEDGAVCYGENAELTVEGIWSQGSPSSFNPMQSKVNWSGTLQVTGPSTALRFHDLTIATDPVHVIQGMERDVEITGTFTNNSNPNVFSWGVTGRMIMAGATSIVGSGGTKFRNLTIEGGQGTCELQTSIEVSGELELLSGRLHTNAFDCKLDEYATVSGAGPTSFVDGALTWHFSNTNPIHVFPVGGLDVASNPLYTETAVSGISPIFEGDLRVQAVKNDHPDISNSGLLAAKRMHSYIKIVKQPDLVSPLFRVTLSWSQAEEYQGFDLSKLSIAQFDASTGWSAPQIISKTPSTPTTNGTIDCYCVHFSDFVLGEFPCTSNCNDSLELHVFIQGFYLGGGQMTSPLFNSNPATGDPEICDFITVELRSGQDPNIILLSEIVALHIDGLAKILIPPTLKGQECYIVVKHRNSIETWSKLPYPLVGTTMTYDFTQ